MVVCGGSWWFNVSSKWFMVVRSGVMSWFVVVCSGSWWFMVVRGGLMSWFMVVCGGS